MFTLLLTITASATMFFLPYAKNSNNNDSDWDSDSSSESEPPSDYDPSSSREISDATSESEEWTPSDIYLADYDFGYQVATELIRNDHYVPPTCPPTTPPKGIIVIGQSPSNFLRGVQDGRLALVVKTHFVT